MIDLNRFNLPNPNNVEGISPVIISKLLNAKKTIEEMFDELEKEAEKRLNAGEDIPGYAMRPGSNQKSWSISEEELVLKLKACKLKKDDIYISKLISPAQVLAHESLTKVQKERIEENYIKLTPDKMKLKPLSKKDKEESILDMFSDIDLQCKTSSDKVSFL